MIDTEFVCLDGKKEYPVEIINYDSYEPMNNKKAQSEFTILKYLSDDFKFTKSPQNGKKLMTKEMKSSLAAAAVASILAATAAYGMLNGMEIKYHDGFELANPIVFSSIFDSIKNGDIGGMFINAIEGIGGVSLGLMSKDAIEKVKLSVKGLMKINKYEKELNLAEKETQVQELEKEEEQTSKEMQASKALKEDYEREQGKENIEDTQEEI